MTPGDLSSFLDQLIKQKLQLSTMIWGPPGIGKSSIVAQTAARHKIGFIDLRLSQLAPTDLRGLPVADQINKVSSWLPPEFLPRSGDGILFLDEINLAPPTMQGMAQQLILDRRVGSYEVPDGWFIWAAGNRKEDRATVFDMPAPLANRFIHVDVTPDLESFKEYALENNTQEEIIAFVGFRPNLLHKMESQQPAWPSPRSWMMASKLMHAGLSLAPAIGAPTATEFNAFCQIYTALPNLPAILAGDSNTIDFPSEPSVRYATVVGLAVRASDASEAYHAYKWLVRVATPEWFQLCAIDINRRIRARKERTRLMELIEADEDLKRARDAVLQLAQGDTVARAQTFARA